MHPPFFVLLDQYSLNDTVIRASGKFYALGQILSKVGSFDNIHRFAIYTRKHSITRILQSYLKLRGIGFMELRDPADIEPDVIDPKQQFQQPRDPEHPRCGQHVEHVQRHKVCPPLFHRH